MLTRVSRWTTVRETMRRERRAKDLCRTSRDERRSKRVLTLDQPDRRWPAVESELRRVEDELRRLDPTVVDFWLRYQVLEDRLAGLFASAGRRFSAR